MATRVVTTALGELHVTVTGTGPPVVLWHSLFVDSTSWGPLVDELAGYRTVYAVDGPSHGASDPVTRDFSMPECVDAAVQVLDGLGLAEPVDWVGNAWGGHVGLRLAVDAAPRIRTLTTIGTPIRGFTPWEKMVKGWPLVWLYRWLGPVGPVTGVLSKSLIGPETLAVQPDRSRAVMRSFTSADRVGMTRAIRSLMLRRTGIAELLPEVDGGGHVAPLLVDSPRIARLIREFFEVPNPSTPSPA